jgi:hypothetical protein
MEFLVGTRSDCKEILVPKGQNIQPALKSFAHMSLYRIIGEISAHNADSSRGDEMPGLKDRFRHRLVPVREKTIASLGRDLAGRDAGKSANATVFSSRTFFTLRG